MSRGEGIAAGVLARLGIRLGDARAQTIAVLRQRGDNAPDQR
jgi:hypothetical protein